MHMEGEIGKFGFNTVAAKRDEGVSVHMRNTLQHVTCIKICTHN